ncbi:unnamed protein product [Spirodela intermedia]|uniref:aldehyde oxygenase (deformylating) n=1 Tax=Spirodela intermedia TaxID=51605 RepID=A0A7I8IPR5_SPIIN|nr:unnamed protein product [Spirodela intermedia]CAA6659771.1 unnamed protein product [Spirodela intermedia]
MELVLSDELLGTFVPIIVYWLYSGLYVILGNLDSSGEYRLHPRSEEAKNIVSKLQVVKGVLVQQAFQIVVALCLFALVKDDSQTARPQPPLLVVLAQMVVAMLVLDTWQYFMHRYMHINKFLYKHVHSKHHMLVPRTGIFFFSFATVKTVDDHCGMCLPGNVFHMLFGNNSAYHDIHHQLYGNKYNFSQPFFVAWDRILGTHMPYKLERRKEGGLEARPAKD